jgi:hypothetical protein
MCAVDVLVRYDNFVFRRQNTQLPPGLCACTHPAGFPLMKKDDPTRSFVQLNESRT